MRSPWNAFGAVVVGGLVVTAAAVLASDHRDPHPTAVVTTTTALGGVASTTTALAGIPSTTVPPTTTTTVRAAVAPPSTGRSLGTFKATCYGAFEGYGGRTASGEQSGPGSIAVDPRVIPMGTKLVVAGYGPGHANDVGGAIKGRRIDVWERTAAECAAWGMRPVEVFAQ